MKKKQQRKRRRVSIASALRRSAERRALQLSLLADRERQLLLSGKGGSVADLVKLEEAAERAAAAVVEKQELRRRSATPPSITVEFVNGQGVNTRTGEQVVIPDWHDAEPGTPLAIRKN